MNRPICIYALKSEATGRVLLGQTLNLRQRLLRHNAGRFTSTAGERPWVVVRTDERPTRLRARLFVLRLTFSRRLRAAWMERGERAEARAAG
ncbi:GIY-YIG nuclease family protein [Congregicoccus parvus]|uniref:GIY-YIG nuclease family protein n=1 Tax=Congregicoccus parvus TaxID=3081749 RepID=UPI003FA5F714